ncbi:tail fiber domain-containing protein [Psychroserpens sp. BH13MA-6]
MLINQRVLLTIIVLTLFNLSNAQVGVGTTTPNKALDVQVNAAADGIQINNTAADGDPTLELQVNGTTVTSIGIDDSDADKFKIGTTALTTNTRLTLQTNGFLGINTTTPGYLFHMTNGGNVIGATSMASFENSSVSGVGIASSNTDTTNGYNALEGITYYEGNAFIPAGVFGLAIYTGGGNAPTIGVRGHTNEWQGTGVRGSRFNGGGPNTGWGGEFYDDLGYTGFLGTISDERTKKNISPINNALAIIEQLNPVTYYFDLEKYPTMGLNEDMEYGFIAQEVRAILPEITRIKGFDTTACSPAKAGEQVSLTEESFVAIDYTRMIPILTKGLQEQQQTIANQATKIQNLESKIQMMEAKLNQLLENQD